MTTIVLAPMEGLVDAAMRSVLTRVGGYDWCVTEFARVSSTPLSEKRLLGLFPELGNGGRTPAGTRVRLQLLGSDPLLMAESAALAAGLGPFGIDLNFGCPAPTVNRHCGGAALLNDPERLRAIAAAVRRAVPDGVPVSAKMRLGIDDPDRALECAQALEDGGAGELVVHARTRADGYRHPARWEWIGRIREFVGVPVIANGDVWTVADWEACRGITGCSSVMLGRGAIADPFLAYRLRDRHVRGAWTDVVPLLREFWSIVQADREEREAVGRLKQWLRMLGRKHAQAGELFSQIRSLHRAESITKVVAGYAESSAGAG